MSPAPRKLSDYRWRGFSRDLAAFLQVLRPRLVDGVFLLDLNDPQIPSAVAEAEISQPARFLPTLVLEAALNGTCGPIGHLHSRRYFDPVGPRVALGTETPLDAGASFLRMVLRGACPSPIALRRRARQFTREWGTFHWRPLDEGYIVVMSLMNLRKGGGPDNPLRLGVEDGLSDLGTKV